MDTFRGTVTKGKRYGTSLGYPTVNIPLSDPAVKGIYAARVIVLGKIHQAAAFADQARGVLEAYLLDFSGDLYGEEIEIELCEKIRDSKKFDDEAALREAIATDVAAVHAYFKK